MPRARKGARLWLRPGRPNPRAGTTGSWAATWVIIDGGKHIATGCLAGETREAERRLAEYIAAKHTPARKRRDIEEIDLADVLSIYLDDKPATAPADETERKQRITRLTLFWGGQMLSDVTGETCRRYAAIPRGRGKGPKRPHPGAARRDLEVLRAAINHHAAQGFHRELVKVVLPPKGAPRDRWLTRPEAAALIWTCWRYREVQKLHRGEKAGEKAETARRPLRHLARFILIGLYTGTRAAALAAASPERGAGRAFVDLDQGIFYRLAEGQRATKKRQPPAPIPPRLLTHMRRWARIDADRLAAAGERRVPHFVEFNGRAVASVKTAFKRAVEKAELPGAVSPHTLRHTAATWLMQAGVDKWVAAGFLGMSIEMLDRVYGHHHPAHLREAATRIGYRAAPASADNVVALAGEGQSKARRAV